LKVILIEEDHLVEFGKMMQLREHQKQTGQDNTAERLGWDIQMWHSALNQARKEFHFEFVRWAQSHGASCVQKW
jgi:hypothetical protein